MDLGKRNKRRTLGKSPFTPAQSSSAGACAGLKQGQREGANKRRRFQGEGTADSPNANLSSASAPADQDEDKNDNASANTMSMSSAATKVMKYVVEEDILKRIASNLRIADLRSLRQICKTWNRALIPSFRLKHAPIRLTNLEEPLKGNGNRSKVSQHYKKWQLEHGRTIADFNHEIATDTSTLTEFPFAAYNLVLDASKKECPDLQTFMENCGSSTRRLSLEGAGGANQWRLNLDLVRKLLHDRLPNLTALELDVYDCGFDGEDQLAGEESQTLNLAHLTHLKLAFDTDFADPTLPMPKRKSKALVVDLVRGLDGRVLKVLTLDGDFDRLLPIVRDFTPRLVLNNLQKLEFTEQPSAAEFEILNGIPFLQLNAFVTVINPRWKVDPPFVHQLHTFLVSRSDCLRSLELKTNRPHDGNMEPPPRIRIPGMTKLSEFRIKQRGRAGPRFFQFDALTMNDTFPALEIFGYSGSVRFDADDDMLAMDIMGHQGVTSLELNFEPSIPEHEVAVLRQLGTGFPSVVHLELSLFVGNVTASLVSIWSMRHSLETATLKYYRKCFGLLALEPLPGRCDLDEALSGVALPAKEKKQLASTCTLEEVRALFAKHKTALGLSDMTRLRSLVLDFTGVERVRPIPTIGDVGGYFGLAMSGEGGNDKFQHFAIIRHASRGWTAKAGNKISAGCEAMIRATLGPHAELHF